MKKAGFPIKSGMTKNIFPVRPELVEGYSWFDRLTTNEK
jgi:hypothetical protein